jgi:hypothetical protein
MNINLTIELKKEYMAQLTNILNPLIYDGLKSIYDDAKKNSKGINILKEFQSRLIIIKDWTQETIEHEVRRIISETKSIPWLFDLIQAIFKTNQIILGVDEIKDINIKTFVFQIYIECSREFWMNPYLFYHEYTPLEIKQNINMILTKITCCIENSIRRLLPMRAILDKFLGENSTNNKQFSIAEIYNMPLLFKLDLNEKTQVKYFSMDGDIGMNQYIPQINDAIQIDTNKNLPMNLEYKNQEIHQSGLKDAPLANIVGGSKQSDKEHYGSLTSDTNNKILKIINNQNFKLSESNLEIKKKSHHKSRESDSSAILKKIINESINTNQSTGLNSMIKNNLLKNLESDKSHSETENTFNPNQKYQDFFSNSEIKKDTVINDKDEIKNKFFNNYLNI